MATSLSYDFSKQIDINKVVQDAYAQCGVNPCVLSGWQYEKGNESFNFLMTSWLSKRGLNLFTVQQDMIEIFANQRLYALPLYTSKILECIFANAQQIVLPSSAYTASGSGNASTVFTATPTINCNVAFNGWIQCIFPTPQPIQYIGIQSAFTFDYQLEFQAAFVGTADPDDDPLSYITILQTPLMTYYKGQTRWFSLPYTPNAKAWVVRGLAGDDLQIKQILLEIPTQTIQMQRVGRDSYTFFPLNQSQQGPSTCYYMNRADQPTLNVWTNPNNEYQFFIYNCVRSIQDAGSFTDTLDMTPRFLEACTTGLAARLSKLMAPDRQAALQTLADQLFIEAAREDTENVDMKMAINSEGYLG